MEEIIFEIIVHAGNARALAYEALKSAQAGEIEAIDSILDNCKKEMTLAHNMQTKLVQDEIRGEDIKISLLLIHAQDQLMTTMSEQTLILQMIEMQKEINQLKKDN